MHRNLHIHGCRQKKKAGRPCRKRQRTGMSKKKANEWINGNTGKKLPVGWSRKWTQAHTEIQNNKKKKNRERRKTGPECHQFPDRGRQCRRLHSNTAVSTGTNNGIMGKQHYCEAASLFKANPLLDQTTAFGKTNGLLGVTVIKSLHH